MAVLAPPGLTVGGAALPGGAAGAVPAGPERIHFDARARAVAAGARLTPEEEAKAKKNALDLWDEIEQAARDGRYPKGTDVLLWKFHGLFYVAPAQDSFMCRMRVAGGIMNSHQMRAVAALAEDFAGGYAHVTTRANLQIREIAARHAPQILVGLADAGLTSRGSGADNVRNITGSPTAGIDAQELLDTRPLCQAMHHFILNHRELYGLPRKFNIAFDGGGRVAALDDTNDIGFFAVRVGAGNAVPPGVYLRMRLGGITGHHDFAADAGVLLRPDECVRVAEAVLRVFIDLGDRSDRKKARMKYVLDAIGHPRYLELVEEKLGRKLVRFAEGACEPRPPVARSGHVGFHAQAQPGFCYAGVALPVGRVSVTQLRGLAQIADRFGSGTLRLTVWQNLLISDIRNDDVGAVKAAIEDIGLAWQVSPIRAGLIACTGNTGCKFSASDTKRHALEIADYVEARVNLVDPVNIHLTGCHHSCAQHYIGDIGLLGAKVEQEGDAEAIEGYHVYVGGGYGADRALARELFRDVPAGDVPPLLESLLRAYQRARRGPDESFQAFSLRYDADALRSLAGKS